MKELRIGSILFYGLVGIGVVTMITDEDIFIQWKAPTFNQNQPYSYIKTDVPYWIKKGTLIQLA